MNVLGEKAKAYDIAGKGELNNFVSATGPLLIENDAPRLNEIEMGLALTRMEKKLVPQDAYDGRVNDEGWALLGTRRYFVGHADLFVRKSLLIRACSGFSEFVTPTAIAIPCDGSILSPAAIACRSRRETRKAKSSGRSSAFGGRLFGCTNGCSHHIITACGRDAAYCQRLRSAPATVNGSALRRANSASAFFAQFSHKLSRR
jgi:hypothetical protein